MSEGRGSISRPLFIVSGGFLLAAIVAIGISVAEGRAAAEPEPPWPEGVPVDVPVYYGAAEVGHDSYLLPFAAEIELTVEFEPCRAIEGLWNGADAELALTAPRRQDLPAATHTEEWGEVLVSSGGTPEVTPWVEGTLALDAADLHRWLALSAALEVTFPSSDGTQFRNIARHPAREIGLYVISADERALVEAHTHWVDAAEQTAGERAGRYICPGLFLLAAIVFLALGIADGRAQRASG